MDGAARLRCGGGPRTGIVVRVTGELPQPLSRGNPAALTADGAESSQLVNDSSVKTLIGELFLFR